MVSDTGYSRSPDLTSTARDPGRETCGLSETSVSTPDDKLVFVPNVGFRLAHGGLQSPNTVARQGPRTLTVGVTSDRDGADLSATISGVDEQLDFRTSRHVDAPVKVVDDHGRVLAEQPSRYYVNSHFYRLMEGPTQFQRMVALDRIHAEVRSLEFAMSGGAGDWKMQIPLEPVTRSGPQGFLTHARATVNDIEISVTLVARTPTLTAIELETYDLRRPESVPIDLAERWIEGVGTFGPTRGLGQDLLMLWDSTGAHHLERPRGVQDRGLRARRREVALFEAMPERAVAASVEIPYVAVRERSDELKVPVPLDDEITLNGCRARVVTSRVERSDSTPGHPSPIEGLNGPCVRIVIAPRDPEADRQLVMVGVMESNDRGMTVSRIRTDLPVIEVPDPAGDSEFITFKNPVILLRGPWNLEFPLPAKQR
jgi:hypothetical protein